VSPGKRIIKKVANMANTKAKNEMRRNIITPKKKKLIAKAMKIIYNMGLTVKDLTSLDIQACNPCDTAPPITGGPYVWGYDPSANPPYGWINTGGSLTAKRK
jgi:hypothetical protein